MGVRAGLILVALLAGCSDKKKPEPRKDEVVVTPDAAPLPVMPTHENPIVQQFYKCLDLGNRNAWRELRETCFAKEMSYEAVGMGPPTTEYAADNITDPQRDEPILVLVDDRLVVAVLRTTGRDTGPYLTAKLTTLDADNKYRRIRDFYDEDDWRRPPVKRPPIKAADVAVVFKQNDMIEQANVRAFRSLMEAHDKHDADAFGALVADNVVWSPAVTNGTDLDKAGLLKSVADSWRQIPDLTFRVDETYPIGDFIVAVQLMSGVSAVDDVTVPMQAGKKVEVPFLGVYRFESGKLRRAIVFYQTELLVEQLTGKSPRSL